MKFMGIDIPGLPDDEDEAQAVILAAIENVREGAKVGGQVSGFARDAGLIADVLRGTLTQIGLFEVVQEVRAEMATDEVNGVPLRDWFAMNVEVLGYQFTPELAKQMLGVDAPAPGESINPSVADQAANMLYGVRVQVALRYLLADTMLEMRRRPRTEGVDK